MVDFLEKYMDEYTESIANLNNILRDLTPQATTWFKSDPWTYITTLGSIPKDSFPLMAWTGGDPEDAAYYSDINRALIEARQDFQTLGKEATFQATSAINLGTGTSPVLQEYIEAGLPLELPTGSNSLSPAPSNSDMVNPIGLLALGAGVLLLLGD